ncbi:MAG: hypothetical protein CMD16_05395 [Flavobacteriales bacterium]|nr:hypothetical protein [Flavobacteriales bacterium]
MNVEYFIARKLFTAKEENNSYTRPILRIAILAIALSVSVMLLSVMVVTGFKDDISNKVLGFNSHITISNFTNNQSYESEPISIEQDFYPSIKDEKGIKNINVFATKAGIVKTADEIHGVILKGVSFDYDWSFFKDNLVSGNVFDIKDSVKSNNILISEEVAKKLKLEIDDDFIIYFVQDPPRVRKFKIKGIYNTSMIDFDKLFVIADLKHIQSLNGWSDYQVGGFEITIDNFDNLNKLTERIYEQVPYDLNAQSIKEKVPQIFDWLDLQDINVRVILVLMLVVGVINMITALLILILERTRMIGILKAIGANNWSVRKVFLYSAVHLIVKGLFLGNLIGLGFGFLQQKFRIISLDPETYYMNTVPINFDLSYILLLNIGTIIVCYLILIIPSVIITKITPIKAIRFQ